MRNRWEKKTEKDTKVPSDLYKNALHVVIELAVHHSSSDTGPIDNMLEGHS